MAWGKIDVWVGPMFAGKTSALIRMVRAAEAQGKVVACYKPEMDTRDGVGMIASHDGEIIEVATAYGVSDVSRLKHVCGPDGCTFKRADLVAIDEAQFFSKELVEKVCEIASKGTDVVMSMLDMDCHMNEWPVWFTLKNHLLLNDDLRRAVHIHKMLATCSVCGGEAPFSKRIDGSTGRISVGAEDKYEPRCEACFSFDRNGRAS